MANADSVQYLSLSTLEEGLRRLFGTADHLLKIWLTLKQMGMGEGKPPALVTTSSPDEALVRLFSYGSPEGDLFVPFAHTPRFMKMKGDAGRSIIQTTIQRWKTSGSVVTCDPTSFLNIQTNEQDQLLVGPTRSYPLGLGLGRNGFALEDDKRVSVPDMSFAVWYYRQSPLPKDLNDSDLRRYMVSQLRRDLNFTSAEFDAIFIDDDLRVATSGSPIPDSELFAACDSFLYNPGEPTTTIIAEDFSHHSLRIRSMKTINEKPQWLNRTPINALTEILKDGARAVLLYGPPRSGKTRAIDKIVPRKSPTRTTIQIHDGWAYDNLVQGFRPDDSGKWVWNSGPLKKAIDDRKKTIVLEEINRTNLTQALGEVFSLIEDNYRGNANAVTLRSGDLFFVPEDVVFLMTMNTLDKSTEDIDDAMIGRLAAIEFPPRIEDLVEMLSERDVNKDATEKLRALFAFVQDYYPLGHGYFAGITKNTDWLSYYATRIRPVLANHFRNYRPENLDMIDNKVNSLFAI